MIEFLANGLEIEVLTTLIISLIAGFVIGVEREARGKYAGISTNCFVIAGSALFTLIGMHLEPTASSRIAAQIVTGVGFLGAGIILKDETGKITNLTTAASIWFAASIGMSIGFGWYLIALIAMIYAIIVPRLPHLTPMQEGIHHDK